MVTDPMNQSSGRKSSLAKSHHRVISEGLFILNDLFFRHIDLCLSVAGSNCGKFGGDEKP